MSGNNGKLTLKKAEDKIGEYREIFNMLPIGIYRTSVTDGTFLKANPACAEILGYDNAEDLVGTQCLYYDPADRLDLLDKLNEMGTIDNYELKLLRKDGTSIWVTLTARIHDKGYVEGSLVDVTDRKRIEEELESFKEKEIESLKVICEAAKSYCRL